MIIPLKEMYNTSGHFLTTYIPTDETAPVFWQTIGDDIDKWLLFRAAGIGVNDNVGVFVANWFDLNKRRLQAIYDNYLSFNTTPFENEIDVTTETTDRIAERADNREFKNLGGADTTTTTPNTTATHYTTSYENTPDPVTRTEYSDANTGTTTNQTVKTSQHTDNVTHTAHNDTHTTNKSGHDRPLTEMLRDSIDTHSLYAFCDTFVNIFIHDMTTGVYV